MKNTNIEYLRVVKNPAFYVDPAFYTEQPYEDIPMTAEEEEKFMKNIDMETLDKILETLEKEIENPDAWIPFEETMDDIRRDILNG